MPTIVLLAGPNGAGKTTFIDRFLKRRAETFVFVNPDKVAHDLLNRFTQPDRAAPRRMSERLEVFIHRLRKRFAETLVAKLDQGARKAPARLSAGDRASALRVLGRLELLIHRLRTHYAETFVFVNPDEVARDLPGVGPERDLAAGRRVLEQLDALIAERADIVLETTLATRSHARRLKACRAAGYRIELTYLRLPDVEASIARVRRRVERGGHGIPEATLRRRFPLSLDYLETIYKPLVDSWEVYANGDDGFDLLDWGPR